MSALSQGRKWKTADIIIATTDGPEVKRGYDYCGLGIFMIALKCWSLTHLGSGLCVCHIHGVKSSVLQIATEVAEKFNWDWSGLNGWQNVEPDLMRDVPAFLKQLGNKVELSPSGIPGREMPNSVRLVSEMRQW